MSDCTRFDNVGDLIDYLSNFPRRTKVRGEYDGSCYRLSASEQSISVEKSTTPLGQEVDQEYFTEDAGPEAKPSFTAIVF